MSRGPVSTAEAITQIEAARCPEDLFGGDAASSYRRLARLTHPDAHRGDARAAAAFAKLAAMWRERQDGPERFSVSGDIADLYRGPRGLLKLARDPADNDLMDAESRALTRLRADGDRRYLAYVPTLIGAQRRQDPSSGAVRHGSLLERLDGFCTLAEVHAAFPSGIDPRDAAWMWRRLMVALGFAHRTGVLHGAVLPEHVMIHPQEHGLVLVDWCYSVTSAGGAVPAVVGRYRDWYPPDLLARQPAAPGTDIYLAARCMTYVMGEQAPRPLLSFAGGCRLRNPRRRPGDAWRLLAEFDDLIDRLYGPRTFRPFAMPA